MMDRTEAIKELMPFTLCDVYSDNLREACQMAIAALREQEQSNEPLTFSQLWDMAGEPIWIVWPDGRIKSKWWIVGSHEWHMMEFTDSQSAREYGTVWVAYRVNGNDYNACKKCAIYEKCEGAYIDILTKIIKVEEDTDG